MKLMTHSPEETHRLAATFAGSLPPNAIVGLVGTLGAGKTAFVQGMAAGLGINPEGYVTSPTFALIHEYLKEDTADIVPTLIHFDLYRLQSFEELIDIGLEDYTGQDGIVVLEWADRFPELVGTQQATPILTHRVEIEIVGAESRHITLP